MIIKELRKMIVTPSMSLVAAGVASGICFLLFSSIRKGRGTNSRNGPKQIVVDDSRCACCLKPFLVGRGIRCNDCAARSCRKSCSRWDTSDNAWHCLLCHQQRCWLRRNEKWFDTFGGGSIDEEDLHRFFGTAKSRVYVAGVEDAAATSSGLALATKNQEEPHKMETVRDFLERIVEDLIGNVDDTSIDRLYDHPAYDKLLARYIVPLAGALVRLAVALQLCLANKPTPDPPTMAHTALREIVERAVEEARKLPGLETSGEMGRSQEGRNIAEHSYEDLLATAILNKVIEKFQREQVDGNSNVLHEKSASRTKCTLSENEDGVEEGCSSLEPSSRDDCSDCSATSFKRLQNHAEPLSLTIEERIEEVTTTYASDEEHRDNDILALRNTHRVPFPELGMDIIDPSQESSEDSHDEPDTPTTHVDLVSPVESWEENWLFQKKKVQVQADPVAMLVPNPSADFKALIGDKDAEDTSDLSECSSNQSDDEIEKELMEAISNVVPRSPRKMEFAGENNLEQAASIEKNHCETRKNLEAQNPNEKETESAIESEKEVHEESETKETEVEKLEDKNRNAETEDKNTISRINEENSVEQLNSNELFEKILARPLDSLEFASISMPETRPSNAPESRMPTTRSSMTEATFECANDAETFAQTDENLINSPERAKRNPMSRDDAALEIINEKDSREISRHKPDFHAEDVQQESEYTEHYDIATQRHLDSLTKTDSISAVENDQADNETKNLSAKLESSTLENGESVCRETGTLAKAQTAASCLSPRKEQSEEEVHLATPPRPGTIAEREHKKWENAPPIENNPYSEENIQKRLWERQYARRSSSDVSGIHAELAKSNGTDLEVVLRPHQPDIKRFGRDYYINDSKSASGERGRRSAASSRPSSSLSQGSSSTGLEQERQEETQYKEASSHSNDVKSKVAKWQINNAEANYETSARRTGNGVIGAMESCEAEKVEEKCQKNWENHSVDELLENERKNSKNEINAKLNNQENYENGGKLETKNSYSEDNQRKIRRIDLKAFGFENEFCMNGSGNDAIKTSSQRVVNKLDLRSFGYGDGDYRSNNRFDTIVTNKSNLRRRSNDLIETQHSGDRNFAQSTETLNKLDESYDTLGSLKTAKSVPSMPRCDPTKFSIKYEDGLYEDSANDTDNSSGYDRAISNEIDIISNDGNIEEERLSMPSVRRLAQAFNRQPQSMPLTTMKATKPRITCNERSTTPEIDIVETPRQMHSLTARSLSKKFREGLRQIPNRVTSPPASYAIVEKSKPIDNQTEVVHSKPEFVESDTNVIAPGKLKSNIIFWEKMQRRS